jgi:hypothetical protein
MRAPQVNSVPHGGLESLDSPSSLHAAIFVLVGYDSVNMRLPRHLVNSVL